MWRTRQWETRGVRFETVLPDVAAVKALQFRNEFTDEQYNEVFLMLSARFANKEFIYSTLSRCQYEIRVKIQVLLTMLKVFDDNPNATDIYTIESDNKSQMYTDTDLYDDALDIEDREKYDSSGSTSQDIRKSYSVNHIVNRENRLYDFITKKIAPLFRTQVIYQRTENYDY